MSDGTGCEPPPEWRDRDGDFWLERDGQQGLHVWLSDPQCWLVAAYDVSPGAMYARGYRYVAPVTPPAVVAALVEALEQIDKQRDTVLQAIGATRPMSFDGMTHLFDNARAALAAYREAGR